MSAKGAVALTVNGAMLLLVKGAIAMIAKCCTVCPVVVGFFCFI